MLSRLASEFAAEIKNHDWSDAHIRTDRAGHDRARDSRKSRDLPPLSAEETNRIRVNVMWVVSQVLGHRDSNFNVVEFAAACGVTGLSPGELQSGLRQEDGIYAKPGSWNMGG
ncbi:MAG TPA: hypothetical protein VES21_12395 [Nocardioidaceae bacterium]|nr:hypothetical protein [Nocardioidaceae bacterium]